MRLTDITLRQLTVETGQKRYYDDSTPGFGVTVGKRTKTFFVMRGQTRQLTTIGKYPEISLADARKQAKVLLTQTPTKTAPTGLVATINAYLEDITPHVRPKTLKQYTNYLKNAPDIPLANLSRDVLTTSSSHEVTSWKVFANWCIRNEHLTRNPFTFIPVVYGSRDRVLSNDEIKLLWKYDYPPFSDYLKLLLLTGQRRSQFTDFEIRGDTLFFPARIMKGKRDHTIPLLPLARQYAESLPPFNGWSKAKERLDKHVLIPPFVLHDARRTFSTICASLKIPIHVTEKILDHRTGSISGVSAVYNRYSFLEESRTALLTYETAIANLVNARA